MNQAFSKIWIIVALVVFIASGILAWQYFGAPKEEVPEVKAPEEVIEDETVNWKTYRNEEYGLEFKHPIYVKILDKNVKDISLNPVWGPVVTPVAAFDFELINPATRQKAEAIWLGLKIFNLKGYEMSNYYFGKIAYDANNEWWYKIETGESITEDDPFFQFYMDIGEDYPEQEKVIKKSRKQYEEFIKNYRGIPLVFIKTTDGISVYENFVYGDVGELTNTYVLVNKKKGLVFEFSQHFSENDYYMSPKSNQEFVDKITKDFPEILRSVHFLK